ncbi:F167A protein, partial [Polypterus senegalus]
MELVLTRLRDFSSKSATFNHCDSAEMPPFREQQDDKPEGREKIDIETALAWLRKELMEMRSQDQILIKQLMDLHSGIQELKQEYSGISDVDSESETEDSVYSSSGTFVQSHFSSGMAVYDSPFKKNSIRRSSIP